MNKVAEVYTCVYATEFPAQALLRLRPEWRGRPCVVMEGDPPLQHVCSLNQSARTVGLAPGMTQVEVDAFNDVAVLRRSQNEEAAVKAVLLECAGGFSPRVEDRSEDGAFLCVINIAGTQGLLGPPETLARNLLARIGALSIAAAVAISANSHVAVALAKGLPPRSIHIVTKGEEAAALAVLPLTVLDLTPEQAETFALWGIRTLGELAALPEKELTARMGQPGRRLRQLARGEAPHLFQPVEPPFTLIEHRELDSPAEVLDGLMFLVNLLLEQVIFRATARLLVLASVNLTLSLEEGTTHTRVVRPALATNDRQLWLKLLHLDLEAHPPQSAILAVTLTAEPGSASKAQFGLFSPQLPEPSRLDVTLARIRAIVGDANAGRAVLRDTHQPDGFRMEPFSVPSAEPTEIPSMSQRPAVRRLRPAEAVFVTLQGEQPKMFVFRERRYVVERAYGPWLTDGEWWNQTLWGCEQWDLVARAQDGPVLCCYVVRDLLRKQWQMVALYD